MINSLDLYAKIESLIGFYDEYEVLYSSYLKLLKPLHVEPVLDIGCGNGRLLKLLESSGFDVYGIDRSHEMIKRSHKLGVKSDAKELLDLQKNSFDCALAVGDVLNYLRDDELDKFFAQTKRVLKDRGYFLADINTQVGFEVADGVMVRDSKESFLSIEANYNEAILETNITFFEKDSSGYTKSSGEVFQYFHPRERFENIKDFKLLSSSPISMFSDEDEKTLMLFKVIRPLHGSLII